MKHLSLKLSWCAFVVGLLSITPSAFASVTPTLSLSATGNSDNVLVSVVGDPSVGVMLSYTKTGSGLTISPIGTTDSAGHFSTTLSASTYSLTTGTLITAILNGLSGPTSSAVAWPAVTSANALTLSQSALVLSIGSSATVTASNSGSGSLYVSNNSNPSIANVNISGTSAAILGNVSGSTNITLCQVGGTATNCPSIYVIVNQAGSGQLSFSQTNPTVVNGQSLPVTIAGGNGSYMIVSNSNSSTIQGSISGSVLTLSTGSTSGSASVTVCSSDRAVCGVVNATAGDASSVSLSFSTATPTVSANQSTTVNIYGPTGVTFYVSSNSNPATVQANLTGATLTLTGISAGTSSVRVCASTGTCNSLTITVQYNTGGGPLTLSQNTLSLSSGQSITITISGGSQPYVISGGTSSVSQQTLNGNSLTVYGVSSGHSSVDVCSSGGACAALEVTVNGATAVVTTPVVTAIAPAVTVVAPISTPIISTPSYTFSSYLTQGTQNDEVMELQRTLVSQGYLSAAPTGYYGAQTTAAVKKFQAAHGLNTLGVVGPGTRTALNQIGASGSVSASTSLSSTDISGMTMSQLQARVKVLQTELSQILARMAQLNGQQ